ncbi:MAG: diacylglycerol kinase family lipid kinase [Clostridia bacterium]|nr:diacylglycerol kinase family lipid kinase [Clostridia bacterium]
MYTLIVNPTSGRGAAMGQLAGIEGVLEEHGLKYSIERATKPMDAARIARAAAARQPEGIIAVGGDGTLFEIINGMIGSDVPLLFVSCGTGNDFVRTLRLPKDPVEALRCQLDAPVGRIDVGRMNDFYFLNVAGTGFDVDVLRNAEKYKAKYTGLRTYLFGLFEAIRDFRPMTARVSFDDGPEEEVSFSILSIGNGRYIGGGMKAVPDAKLDDGLFDVVTVRPVSKPAIALLIAFYIAGKHVAIGLGRLRRCRKLSIRHPGMTVNLDGELSSTDFARFELLPNALCVRVPGIEAAKVSAKPHMA